MKQGIIKRLCSGCVKPILAQHPGAVLGCYPFFFKAIAAGKVETLTLQSPTLQIADEFY
jgi:hypothetical protein